MPAQTTRLPAPPETSADVDGPAAGGPAAGSVVSRPETLEALWRQNRGWLAAVLAAHAPRGVEVEDLLQEVAATLVAKVSQVRDAASLRGWLRAVAINEARMAARERGVERRALPRVADSTRPSMADAIDAADAAARDAREMLALVSELPPTYAEPLLLQATRGLSQRAIAEMLEVPETTVETRLARARRMLRRLAAEREMDPDPVVGLARSVLEETENGGR